MGGSIVSTPRPLWLGDVPPGKLGHGLCPIFDVPPENLATDCVRS